MANPLNHFGIKSKFIRGDTSSYNNSVDAIKASDPELYKRVKRRVLKDFLPDLTDQEFEEIENRGKK